MLSACRVLAIRACWALWRAWWASEGSVWQWWTAIRVNSSALRASNAAVAVVSLVRLCACSRVRWERNSVMSAAVTGWLLAG
ncbi:MAG: hypothetical protein JO100_12060 [Pseudonocardia sp.]|nr:hypothetical protein [Pseudonocardia sp.]